MTIEILRPGTTESLKIPDGGFFDGVKPEKSTLLLQSLREGEGFRMYQTNAINSYWDYLYFIDHENEYDEKLEDQYITIPQKSCIQLADGIIAKAT